MKILVPIILLFATAASAEMLEHFGRSLDPETSMAGCIACHNGRTAAAVSRCDNRMCLIYARHLVDVRYPPAGKERSYVAVEAIGIRGFRLFNDRIACLTCHSLTSGNSHLLVTSSEGERFCQECHLV